MESAKQAEKLLRETHHRVKNNFAIIISLINMQLSGEKNEEVSRSLRTLQGQINSIALVHDMLYRSDDYEKISIAGYLRSLTSVIEGGFRLQNIRLMVLADEALIKIDTLIPLGLIIHELITNAFIHAFPNEREGMIWITFRLNAGNGLSQLIVQDNGMGFPENTNLEDFNTMGLKIVQLLCQQLEAKLELSNDQGTTLKISFSLD